MRTGYWVIAGTAVIFIIAIAHDLLRAFPPVDEATALNNQAVLRWREAHRALDAERLIADFRAAADKGLVRAETNMLLASQTCSKPAFTALARRGDSRAASFAADCLAAKAHRANSKTAAQFANCPDEMLELARIATLDDQAAEHMKFGWLLTDLRNGQGCYPSSSADMRLLEEGAWHLLRARELGVPAAAARIGSILKSNPELVARLAVADELQRKPFYEWTQEAADQGHPASNCELGVNLARAVEEGPRPADMAQVRSAAKLIAGCLNYEGRGNPIRNAGGGAVMYGQDGYDDLWRRETAFLLRSVDHPDYNFDYAALNRARSALSLLQKHFASRG